MERGCVLDVRAEGEFARGHLPGARSLPLFTDAERATVGTLYKQVGREAAIDEGLKLAGPKLAMLVQEARRISAGKPIGLYCWRGGMRSSSVAWLLDVAGLQVRTLKGGYKTWRRHAQHLFAQSWPLVVLAGYTGSGKTEVLKALAAAGEQVLDLEALAHHKGSAFGALGQQPQPTTEHFENTVAWALQHMDARRYIWVEDESHTVGRCIVPSALFQQMQQVPAVVLEVPLAQRVQNLVQAYGQFEKKELQTALNNIQRKLGGLAYKLASEALAAGDLRAVATLALTYYDKAYETSMHKRKRQVRAEADTTALIDTAEKLSKEFYLPS